MKTKRNTRNKLSNQTTMVTFESKIILCKKCKSIEDNFLKMKIQRIMDGYFIEINGIVLLVQTK